MINVNELFGKLGLGIPRDTLGLPFHIRPVGENYTKKTTKGRKRCFEASDRTKRNDELPLFGQKLARRAFRSKLGL